MKKILIILITVLAFIVIAIIIGLQVMPAPFESIPTQSQQLDMIPLPDGLPQPVDRFYRLIYGEEIPVIDTAVLSGRARLVFNGITFPARFQFTHKAGQDYHHNIELALFGIPIMKADESYINGNSRMVLPFGTIENEPKVDQAANLGLWAETLWFPSVFLTDARVQWEPVDATTALLHVPFEDETETFTVNFDQKTGYVRSMEVMRYKEADSSRKTLWVNEALEWGTIDGQKILTVGSATWMDDGKPWATFTVEEIAYNINIAFAIGD